ncbi:hypothetical protein BC828DRAFT_175719, partial [Blastocladiella britannica]
MSVLRLTRQVPAKQAGVMYMTSYAMAFYYFILRLNIPVTRFGFFRIGKRVLVSDLGHLTAATHACLAVGSQFFFFFASRPTLSNHQWQIGTIAFCFVLSGCTGRRRVRQHARRSQNQRTRAIGRLDSGHQHLRGRPRRPTDRHRLDPRVGGGVNRQPKSLRVRERRRRVRRRRGSTGGGGGNQRSDVGDDYRRLAWRKRRRRSRHVQAQFVRHVLVRVGDARSHGQNQVAAGAQVVDHGRGCQR